MTPLDSYQDALIDISRAHLRQQAFKTRRAADYYRLSQTERRIAHEYKNWALEDQTAGRDERSEYYRKQSNAYWQSAKHHLRRARQWRPT